MKISKLPASNAYPQEPVTLGPEEEEKSKFPQTGDPQKRRLVEVKRDLRGCVEEMPNWGANKNYSPVVDQLQEGISKSGKLFSQHQQGRQFSPVSFDSQQFSIEPLIGQKTRARERSKEKPTDFAARVESYQRFQTEERMAQAEVVAAGIQLVEKGVVGAVNLVCRAHPSIEQGCSNIKQEATGIVQGMLIETGLQEPLAKLLKSHRHYNQVTFPQQMENMLAIPQERSRKYADDATLVALIFGPPMVTRTAAITINVAAKAMMEKAAAQRTLAPVIDIATRMKHNGLGRGAVMNSGNSEKMLAPVIDIATRMKHNGLGRGAVMNSGNSEKMLAPVIDIATRMKHNGLPRGAVMNSGNSEKMLAPVIDIATRMKGNGLGRGAVIDMVTKMTRSADRVLAWPRYSPYLHDLSPGLAMVDGGIWRARHKLHFDSGFNQTPHVRTINHAILLDLDRVMASVPKVTRQASRELTWAGAIEADTGFVLHLDRGAKYLRDRIKDGSRTVVKLGSVVVKENTDFTDILAEFFGARFLDSLNLKYLKYPRPITIGRYGDSIFLAETAIVGDTVEQFIKKMATLPGSKQDRAFKILADGVKNLGEGVGEFFQKTHLPDAAPTLSMVENRIDRLIELIEETNVKIPQPLLNHTIGAFRETPGGLGGSLNFFLSNIVMTPRGEISLTSKRWIGDSVDVHHASVTRGIPQAFVHEEIEFSKGLFASDGAVAGLSPERARFLKECFDEGLQRQYKGQSSSAAKKFFELMNGVDKIEVLTKGAFDEANPIHRELLDRLISSFVLDKK